MCVSWDILFVALRVMSWQSPQMPAHLAPQLHRVSHGAAQTIEDKSLREHSAMAECSRVGRRLRISVRQSTKARLDICQLKFSQGQTMETYQKTSAR